MSTRAATPVLGIMLMMGFTIAAALALFATGGVLIESSQSSLEEDQARESMEDIASQVDRTLAGPQSVGEFSFDGVGDGTPRVQADTGEFRIIQNDTERYNESIGALEFEHDDTAFAYQGGAVWRADSQGEAVMMRPPDVHYNFRTLTVPIINITGDVTAEQQTGEMRIGDTSRLYPTDPEDDPNPLEGGKVELEIESERYCNGWEEYFDAQAEGSVEQRCGERAENQLTVEFSVPFVLEQELSGGTVRAVEGDHNNFDDSDIEEQGEDYDPEPSLTLLEDRQETCREEYGAENMPSAQEEYSEGGLHCVDEINNSVDFDTAAADEEIQLYVENGIDIDGSGQGGAEVGPDLDDRVTIFLGDSLEMSGGSEIGDKSDPSNMILFLADGITGEGDEEDEDFQGNPEIYALIYGADSTIDLQGTADVTGAIVADTLKPGGNAEVTYSEAFEDFTLEYETGGAPFYFLHIVETEVEFTN